MVKSHLFRITVTVLLFVCNGYGQLSKTYIPMQSSGTIPEAALSGINKIVEDDIVFLDKCKAEEKLKAQQQLSTDYFLKGILLSGNVLFNDSVGNYLNKIMDILLKDKPEVRNKIHIYVTKFSVVNTYTFNRGYILVNIGLVAQVENEAQLAAFLANAAEHFILNHFNENIMNDIPFENLKLGKTWLEHLETEMKYSNAQQIDADEAAVGLLSESPYTTTALPEMLDVLKYSYLPFGDKVFSKSFFETKNLIIPDTFKLTKIVEINTDDANEKSESYNEDIRKRSGVISNVFLGTENSNKKKYVVSKEIFSSVRELSQFELCRIYILGMDYTNAVYGAYILNTKYPDNLFLKQIIAKSLYYLTIDKTSRRRNKNLFYPSVPVDFELNETTNYTTTYEKREGNSQALYYMFDMLNSKEFNTIAISYVWKAHEQFPSDRTLKIISDSLIFHLVIANEMRHNDFSEYSRQELNTRDSLETNKRMNAPNGESEELSKYEKINKEHLKKEIVGLDNFTKYAFVDFYKEKEFNDIFAKALANRDRNRGSEKILKDNKIAEPPPVTLKNDKIVFVNPSYKKYNRIKTDYLVDPKGESSSNKILITILKKKAETNKLISDFIVPADFKTTDVNELNDLGILHDWFFERMSNGLIADYMVLNSDAEKLIWKYNTPYFVFTNTSSFSIGENNTCFIFILCNLSTGEMILYKVKSVPFSSPPDNFGFDIGNCIQSVVEKRK